MKSYLDKLQKPFWIIFGLLLLGITIRLLYFPKNVYFGFDQARDAFVVQEILGGHLKVVGPTTSIPGLFHGALYYYLYAPFYLIAQGSPLLVSLFLRLVNSLGIILIFFTAKNLFNTKVGLLSALFYTFSFEQSQYAIYFNHPAFAVITVSCFYFGLSSLIFKNNKWGFVIALLGLGLSIQFLFLLIYIIPIFLVSMFVFRRNIKLNLRVGLTGAFVFALTILSFILAEWKYKAWIAFLREFGSSDVKLNNASLINYFSKTHHLLLTFIHDNFIASTVLSMLVVIVIVLSLVHYARQAENRLKIWFLLIWLSGGIFVNVLDSAPDPYYYYRVGASISLLIIVAFLVDQLSKKSKKIAKIIILTIIFSNLWLITTQNQKGPLPNINVQTGMLLEDEKKVLDYIYQRAQKDFAVNALTMPFSVNTTWSYLFEWYGQKKYHSVPIWGGDVAGGYAGHLQVVSSRSALPTQSFLIIEPLRGIPGWIIEKFIREEGYFSKVIDEKKIGGIIIQEREKI